MLTCEEFGAFDLAGVFAEVLLGWDDRLRDGLPVSEAIRADLFSGSSLAELLEAAGRPGVAPARPGQLAQPLEALAAHLGAAVSAVLLTGSFSVLPSVSGPAAVLARLLADSAGGGVVDVASDAFAEFSRACLVGGGLAAAARSLGVDEGRLPAGPAVPGERSVSLGAAGVPRPAQEFPDAPGAPTRRR